MTKILQFLKNNIFVTVSSCVFLVYQLLISFLLWNRTGDIPPGFGDAYTYIFGIGKLINHQSLFPTIPYLGFSEHFTYLGYNAILGSLGFLLGLDSEKVFYLSFFIGKIILFFSLIFFLNSLYTNNKNMIAMSLICLSFFVGDGAIHGFYWVVPSFFMVVLFFVLWGIIFSEKKYSNWLIFVISLLYITIHPISIYSITIFIMFGFLAILYKQIIWKKVLKISFFLILSGIIMQSVLYFPSLSLFFIDKNGYETKTSVTENINKSINSVFGNQSVEMKKEADGVGIVNTMAGMSINYFDRTLQDKQIQISRLLPSFPKIWNSYLSWFFRLPFLFFILVLSYYFAVKNKKYNLVMLFSASFAFMMSSLIHPAGERSIIFVFPLTLILISSGICDMYGILMNFYKEKSGLFKKSLKCMYFCMISVGLLAFAVYGIVTVRYYSTIADYENKTNVCFTEVRKKDINKIEIYFTSIEGINLFLSKGFDSYQLRSLGLWWEFIDIKNKDNKLFILEDMEIVQRQDINIRLVDEERFSRLSNYLIEKKYKKIDCGVFDLYQ